MPDKGGKNSANALGGTNKTDIKIRAYQNKTKKQTLYYLLLMALFEGAVVQQLSIASKR